MTDDAVEEFGGKGAVGGGEGATRQHFLEDGIGEALSRPPLLQSGEDQRARVHRTPGRPME